MDVKTVDAKKAKLQDLISWVSAGTEIILTEGSKPIARIVPLSSTESPRVAGLHPGYIWTSADFDEPLPDDFWTEDVPRAA